MGGAEGLAMAAVLVAAVQWIAASWRDFGPFTVAAVGAAALAARVEDLSIAGERRFFLWILLAVAVGAAGWIRGASRGVGRPELVGIALAGAAIAVATPSWLPAAAWGLPMVPLIAAAASPGLVVAVASGVAGLDRPGSRPYVPRVRYRVKVG